jgi:hypothetical protein
MRPLYPVPTYRFRIGIRRVRRIRAVRFRRRILPMVIAATVARLRALLPTLPE